MIETKRKNSTLELGKDVEISGRKIADGNSKACLIGQRQEKRAAGIDQFARPPTKVSPRRNSDRDRPPGGKKGSARKIKWCKGGTSQTDGREEERERRGVAWRTREADALALNTNGAWSTNGGECERAPRRLALSSSLSLSPVVVGQKKSDGKRFAASSIYRRARRRHANAAPRVLDRDRPSALSAEGGEGRTVNWGLGAGERGCGESRACWWVGRGAVRGGTSSLPSMITQQPLISSCR